MVLTPDPTLAAYGNIYHSNGIARLEPTTCVNPNFRERGLEDYHLSRAIEWTKINAPGDTLQWIVNDKHADWKTRLENAGFEWKRHDYVMEISMEAPPPAPVLPDGFVIRSFEKGIDEHAAYETIESAFRDHRGHHDSSYEEWSRGYFEHPEWSPEMSTIVTNNAEIVAAAMVFDYPNLTWVRQLGVRREWRKQGLGLAILHRIFSNAYARGTLKVGLGVDAESLTGATRLYERAGMHIKEHFIRYEKRITA